MQLVSLRPVSFSTQDARDWTMLGNIVSQIVRTELLHEKLSTDNLGLRHEIEVKNRELEQRYEEISVANRFLEQIIDHSPEGMCILDYHGQVVRMNRKMKAMRGKNADDLQNRSPAVIFQDPSLFFNLFERAAKGERASLSDVYMMGSDGRPYPAEVFLTRLDRQTERSDAYLLVVYDQTEKRAFQEHMLRTEKLAALGTMAGGVAHDFNNLLMTMLGNTQLLLLHTLDDKSRQRLESIEMAIQDAAHSLRRLNAFTLDHRKEDPLRVGIVNVDDVIRDAIELTRPRWKNASEKQGHIIEFRHEKCGTRQAAMHASDLREVLTNLILNAVDSMPGGGILTLRSGEDSQQVRIDVSDTGTGIHPEIARKVFDPFFTTKGVGNSGLGLSVCWSLVIRHGGTIEVKSQPGQGSTFSVVLPKAIPRVETAKVDKPVPCSAGCRVLLVDDDKEVLAILRDMIRLSGHKVTATDCPGEALSLLDAEAFDLIVTDLGMPLVTGWEVARKARAINPEVPVVVVTGGGAQYEEAEFRAKGIDMVLSKPVNYEKLQNVLQRFLDGGETHH
jgi:PAS domain S-box-containing protein